MSDNSSDPEDSGTDDDQQPTEETGFDFNSSSEDAESSDESDETSEEVTLDHVRKVVTDEFDETMWGVTEALLSAHATLLIEEVKNCTGVIVVGESGAGKTTAISLFEGLDDQVYRSDDATPASFVSHDASLTDEQLEEVDLLPRIRHKTLTSRDMATWFSGPQEAIEQKMALMAHLMDGEGYSRDSGSHGRRGYRGDYRFTFLGATTPLDPRAWRVMGHTGYRFVFYNLPSGEVDRDELEDELFSETRYQERRNQCQEAVQNFLAKLWDEHDEYGGIEKHFDATDEAKTSITYLAKLVKFSRATLGKDGELSRESPERIGAVLRDIAQGRAILDSRTTIQVKDVQVSARIALSTMPKKRRPLVRALLNPENDWKLTTAEAQQALMTSRPTTLERMKLMDTLELAYCVTDTEDGREPKQIEIKPEFEWPDSLDFPEFGGA